MNLQPIENNGQRVLTTLQLANSFHTSTKIINRNFQRNSEKYVQGKHYYSLTGDDLRKFKASRQIDDSLKYVSVLYLWTEKGAWLHAKSLNSKIAWEAYQSLVDDYYKVRDLLNYDNELESMRLAIANAEQKVEKRLQMLENKVDEQITLNHGEQRRFQKGIASRVYKLASDPETRSHLFRELHREIKDRFAVASYKDVKQKDLQTALRYIDSWIPRKVS
ncbi:ORF6N domain-containing protein [Oceanobacillus kapialis]|uniref:ORF6N domain-containing protein n=1 Tax=Oceanobacillus kapialis TaxID=481353 RepID=A0ABW5Q0A1_9BACI